MRKTVKDTNYQKRSIKNILTCNEKSSMGGGSLSSGLSWPEEKYYDEYPYETSYSEFTRGNLGDTTVEMCPFKSIIYIANLAR